MPPKQSFWFRLGYALERARQSPPTAGRTLRGLKERATVRTNADREDTQSLWPSVDELVTSGAAAAVAKVLDGWQPRGRTGVGGLLRAGAAGAVAALVVDMLSPILRGPRAPLSKTPTDRLLAGVGQGLVYGGVVEPRVPGPAVVKGALYGTAEYAVDPVGGLSHLLGSYAPHHRLPLVAHLLDSLESQDRTYVEHVVFGVALAVLYESSPSSNGIRADEDEVASKVPPGA